LAQIAKGGYKIYIYTNDTISVKRWVLDDNGNRIEKSEEDFPIHGFTDHAKKKIAIEIATASDIKWAAGVLVHEATHIAQNAAEEANPNGAVLADFVKEYRAWFMREVWAKDNKVDPVMRSFRNLDGSINKKAIMAEVRKLYGDRTKYDYDPFPWEKCTGPINECD